ncbi:DUF3060 domain-containing protein [Bosea vaviloviae]|uniref:DUF3060 domain-containing protein n=1 Tax=Bosea vaviloviae TaxID=1526658 RepID=UPI0009F48717|nr:DUF3060 domain-containing protein [Bosea vaviloviae]
MIGRFQTEDKTLKISCSLLAAAIVLLPASAFAEEIRVEGVRMSRDFACDGQDVVISGQGNMVELKGRCGMVKVIGVDHKVSFDDAQGLIVSGMSNVATGGVVASLSVEVTQNVVKATLKPVEGSAEVAVSGADQKVDLVVAGPTKVTVEGSANVLSWTSEAGVKAPTISTSGIDNRVTRR